MARPWDMDIYVCVNIFCVVARWSDCYEIPLFAIHDALQYNESIVESDMYVFIYEHNKHGHSHIVYLYYRSVHVVIM